MKARFLVAIILFILGSGLALAAVTAHGVPWGYRDRAAIMIHAVGGVEVFAVKKGSVDGSTTSIAASPGLGILPGDEIRVGALSAVDLRFPTGDVTLTDGSRVTVEDHAIRVSRGAAKLRIAAQPFRVEPSGFDVAVTFDAGRYAVLADGKDAMIVMVTEGLATASTGESIGPGKAFELRKGRAPATVARPAPPTCRVRCRVVGTGNAIAEGDAVPLTTVWVNGTLISVDEKGHFSIPIPLDGDTGVAVMIARDVADQTCRLESRCAP